MNTQLPNINSYQSALDYLNGKFERPAGHNTRIKRSITGIAIKYHATEILEYKSDGSIVLNNGGWFTSTTKLRYNHFLPNEFSVWQERGLWTITNRELNLTVGWKNGMIILPDGTFEGYAEPDHDDEVKILTKKINKYAKDFTTALLNREIEQPSGGDCWYCCMKTEEGSTLGDATKDKNHLLNHLEEDYYVPSILINIIESHKMSQFDTWVIGNLLGYGDGKELSEWETSMLKRDLPKQIANYFKDRLDIAR